MTPTYFFRKIKDVQLTDYVAIGKLFISIILKPFLKKRYQHCWVVCERPNEARDNGFHFFKYVRQNCKDINCYYAIDKKSVDYEKVSLIGNVIEYGSIKHWLLYLCADYNLSSQKGGKPNAAVCAFLELMNFIDSNFVFLQHGITINNCSWAHASTTQLKYFVTSTIPETNYIKETFGFEPDKIVLTGFPRFDNLHDYIKEKNYILIIPTWRSRFSLKSQQEVADNNFENSLYKRAWEDLLNNDMLNGLMEKNNLKICFFPHPNMQIFLNQFEVKNKHIIVANWKNFDIQEEMKKAAMLITDYSSVFFDMVYMKKPVVFFQFDYEQFRKYDYAEGYFDYKNTPFGKWCGTVGEVIGELKRQIENDFSVNIDFIEEHKRIFPYCDQFNSKRLVKLLKEMDK